MSCDGFGEISSKMLEGTGTGNRIKKCQRIQ